MSIGSKSGSGGNLAAEFPSEQTQLKNPITWYKEKTGKYPNNNEIWWSMKRPPEFGADAPPKLYLEVFDPGLRYQISNGGVPSPKGHFIIPAFFQDRSAVSGVPNLPVKTSGAARPRAIAFFSGRVWYAGVNSIDYSANIYFSPVIERPEQVGLAFQQYDPTSEEIRDLLPSDGGVISIPEVSIVYHMDSFGQSLVIFADNGVWAITGSEGVGFRANDYSVNKISGVPSISNLSFVNAEGIPLWWNRSSINALTFDPNGQLTVSSISDKTIKTFYEEIPEQSKFNAKGTYDPLTKTVQWVYRSETTEDIAEQFVYNRFLNYDTRTDAWTPWSTRDNPRVNIHGLFSIQGQAVAQEIIDVVVGEDEVVVGTDEVQSIFETRINVDSKIKYIVNVLPEKTEDIPPPPVTVTTLDVMVGSDEVVVGTDEVVVTL